MKKILVGVVIFMFVIVFFSVTAKAQNTFTGTWRTVADQGPDKGKSKAHIEIFEKNGVYFGKIIKLLLQPQDTLCDKCEGDLKNKPVVGMINMQDMKKTGNMDGEFGEEYAGGTIMDPENGKTYKCKMWVKGDVLTTRGYIGFFYRTGQWFRVK